MATAVSRLPRRLYKYKSFGVNTLRMLGEAEVYFANPHQFNDPFDCSPTVRVDVERVEVERLWKHLRMKTVGKGQAIKELGNHRYMATEYGRHDDGAAGTAAYVGHLVSDIDDHISTHFGGRGVLSLAAHWDNPLMWSHYADEHRGMCIEFDTNDHRCDRLEPVAYSSTRYLLVSDLIAWHLGKSGEAEQKIARQFFFAKAPQWRYENEWRAIAPKSGVDDAPFRISAIHLGFRIDRAVATAVVKMLADARDKIKFYGMWSEGDGFKLARYLLDVDEFVERGMRMSAKFVIDEFAAK
ncbi:DUF2971 domain-containing protein [Paraburkholderia sp. CNPSo 3272]|uniref:DUF2971 domain-containing protein n=1 Tax=Paraburkholderia sp. CNPSo 3272 TaxID=2940931 RepID=UPI0020B78A93|nr:DUF2971 domain-containing protein [Paraburkholderia sp. CNPSo 3272]MCP3722585.1 DUF2971 domain-containing protein [Paraburkholderia sp. CNPSo 3272]